MIPAQNTIPYRATPWVTLSIVAVCVATFLYQLTLGPAELEGFLTKYALVPARITSPNWADGHGLNRFDVTPLVTSMFLQVVVAQALSSR